MDDLTQVMPSAWEAQRERLLKSWSLPDIDKVK